MNKKILYLLLLSSFLLNINGFSQDCNITSKANDILPDKLCAPVSLTWEVTYRGVNDGNASVEIQADWDDGNAVEIQSATNTDTSKKEWQVTFSHIYPIGGNKCNYEPSAMLVVDGVICTSSEQVQNVTVWDTDNYNGGEMEIDPIIFPICVGNEDGTVFTDVSTWNCTPSGGENDNINSKTRWTQWIYGTHKTIDNVEVDGAVRSYPYSGNIVEATGYVDAPEAPNNVSLFCNSPATAQIGEYFEVTLRNWNYCNPYDDPNIAGPPSDAVNGDFDPIITTAQILIVDTPKTTINPAGPFCSNDSQVWLSGSPNGGIWSGNGVNSSGRFRPSNAGTGIHTITYTTTDSAYGCDGTASIQIKVYASPEPNILPGPNANVCPGDTLNLDGNPSKGDGNITSHLWAGDTTFLNATNIQAPKFSTTTQGSYNLTYTVYDDNGCSGKNIITINVNPVKTHITPHPANTCVGEDLILNGNPSGGTENYITHVWSNEVSNLNVTDQQSVVFNSDIYGDFDLTYTVTDDNGCSNSDNINITVYENPIADAGLNDSICSLSLQLSANISVGNGLWTQILGPGTIIFNDSTSANTQTTTDIYGLYQLEWKEVHGPSCTDKDTIEIRFTEQPVANAGIDDGICGYTLQLSATPSVGIGYWSILNGAGNLSFDDSTLYNATITSDVYGDYHLIWHENNNYGCTDEDTVLISFNLVPSAGFSPINPDGCSPFSVNFNNQSIGGNNYSWDFGNGNTSTEENPTELFYNSGTTDSIYNITLIVSNPGCNDSLTQTVTVHPSPNAKFSHDGAPQCSPSLVNFTNTSTGSVQQIWDWNDNSNLDTANIISHVFINDTVFIINYAVKLIAISSFGCRDTTTDYITVYPNPHYEITAIPDSSCHPADIKFSTSPTGQSYSWDFGNGTSEIGSYLAQSQYTNTTNKDTVYHINLIVTSYFGCQDTSKTTILVHPSPNINFDILKNSGCAPFTTNFTNNSTGANSYLWDFGDGTQDNNSSINISHIYQNNTESPITYYINLSGTNNFGCDNNMTKTILVYPKVTARFISDTVGCSPLPVSFFNQSFNSISYSWNFGNGNTSTEENPTFVFINNSTYDTNFSVQLIAHSNYACTDTFVKNITVYASPTAKFNVQPSEQTYPNSSFIINNLTDPGNWQYQWDFGDGNISSIPDPTDYTYNSWGEYDIWLKVYSAYCEDSTKKHVTIIAPPPTANFYFNPDSGCAPLKIIIHNLSIGADQYLWDFGDGVTSKSFEPTHTYYDEGIYYINLTATGESGSDESFLGPISVYPTPEAHFEVAPDVVFIPEQAIKCYNLTTGEDSVFWNFGDGTSSSEDSPLHYYQEEGFFDITLYAISNHMCIDTAIIEQAVDVRSEGKIDFPNAFKPNISGSNGGRYPTPDTDNIVFHPIFKGVLEYELNIFNRWGELIFVSTDIDIGWDGFYRGKLCKQDVYVWKVEGKYLSGKQFTFAGDVTLLR